MKINSEIVFGATVAVSKEEAELSNMDIMRYKKDKLACDLGVKIAEEKGWDEYEEDGLLKADIRLYVFTPQELKDFVDLRLENKLKEMADESTRNR